MINIDSQKLDSCLAQLKRQLLDKCNDKGYWTGRLSSSALSTATAVCALDMDGGEKHSALIRNGIEWLIDTQGSDGGWGDTPDSVSNLPTTLLCRAVIEKAGFSRQYTAEVTKSKDWIASKAAGCEPADIAKAVEGIYGDDKTFSVPILTMCALCGMLGPDEQAWKFIKPLPYELAVFSPELFKWLRLSVVSYALPALIAIGQVNFHKRKPFNPITLALRYLTRRQTLELLERIQPDGGGYLEAVPLTSFVAMSLIGSGNGSSEVVKKGIGFLRQQVGDDGSWPIDTNLSTWVTTLSVNAISEDDLSVTQKEAITAWLLAQQHTQKHPYTNADPGGWAWTDLPGGVPDADDTPGALLALHKLIPYRQDVQASARLGIRWLMGLQNSDGGVPTFCKGWTKLDFDKSSPDLTSHTLAAMSVWISRMDELFSYKMLSSMKKMIAYLTSAQQNHGSWIPLWFGNQYSNKQENPVYGTSRVLIGLSRLDESLKQSCEVEINKGVEFLLSVQNDDGGFGGDRAVPSSIEETSVAVEALARTYKTLHGSEYNFEQIENAITEGTNWIIDRLYTGESITPSPIGLYFAKLWYSEELYPLIFARSALSSVQRL